MTVNGAVLPQSIPPFAVRAAQSLSAPPARRLASGIDSATQGADLSFTLPEHYRFGHVDWSIDANYNQTSPHPHTGNSRLTRGHDAL